MLCGPLKKALSNQKFLELEQRFPGQVGLLTGDASIGHTRPVVVITTEVLHAKLYGPCDGEAWEAPPVVILDEVRSSANAALREGGVKHIYIYMYIYIYKNINRTRAVGGIGGPWWR